MIAFVYLGFLGLCLPLLAVNLWAYWLWKRPLFLGASIFYSLPPLYEFMVQQNCTGECNIRVDLLYLFPLELLVTLILCVLSIIRMRRGKKVAGIPPYKV